MKFSILQHVLSKALGTVGPARATRSTLPVLSNVYMNVEGQDLRLSATNLEIGITTLVRCVTTHEEGAITIPFARFSDWVNSLPDGPIHFELDKNTATLQAETAKFQAAFRGIDAMEFPAVPVDLADTECYQLLPKKLSAMLDRVSFAAAEDESRPILTGVLFQLNDDGLTTVAGDGFRLSKDRINEFGTDPRDLLVPAKAASLIGRLAKSCTDSVFMKILYNKVLFDFGRTAVTCQLIEGRFPDYNQIIPKSHSSLAIVDRKELYQAVRTCQLFARDSANILKIEIVPPGGIQDHVSDHINLLGESAELGDSVVTVDAQVTADKTMEIAFNAKYLMEVLSAINTDKVILETSSSSLPGVIRPADDTNFIHVIMPMHIENEKK